MFRLGFELGSWCPLPYNHKCYAKRLHKLIIVILFAILKFKQFVHHVEPLKSSLGGPYIKIYSEKSPKMTYGLLLICVDN